MESTSIIPVPRCEVSIRPATTSDYGFIDRLQDMHTKMLGFMPKSQLEGKIAAGHVLVAEDETRLPIGYVMSQDRYFKRDDVGIIYQLNIAPGKQRSLVGASFIKAVFGRAAYGCKLFCCWCAQDLNANYFWEALGFVPLAFRAGAKGKRAHILWQRRIREGDVTTSFWYPCKADGGMMREGRIVLPIPPRVKWSDQMPMLLPEVACPSRACLPSSKKDMGETPMLRPPTTQRVRFGPPSDVPVFGAPPEKPKAAKKAKAKVDPVHLAKSRELRDRYLEQFNSGFLPAGGKYEVSRQIAAGEAVRPVLSLPVAA